MSDLVGNPEDRFSLNEAQILVSVSDKSSVNLFKRSVLVVGMTVVSVLLGAAISAKKLAAPQPGLEPRISKSRIPTNIFITG